MHILYLHQYFQTPSKGVVGVAGTRSYEFAKRFVEAGHRVSMLTTCTNPPADAPNSWYETNEDGIEVHWLPLPYENQMGAIARVKAFLRFAFASSRKAHSIKADVIYATSSPLTIALPAMYASKRNNIPFVFEVRDLWPEAPRQMGVLTNPILFRMAKWLELTAYRRAAHVVALSPGQKAGIVADGIPEQKVSMIPNSSDLDLFHPGRNGDHHRERLGLGSRFVLIYFGTMGQANGLSFVVETARVLMERGEKDIVFVLHGTGKTRKSLEELAAKYKLDNLVFSAPLANKTDIADMAAMADVCMTIYKNVPILYTCSPNKMFDAFAAGKPVLTNMPGWLQSLVEDNKCGVFVEPDNVQMFADKAVALKNDRAALVAMGENSRLLAERRFARDNLAVELQTVLEEACEKRT
ncbi:MAG: glycosyltransferase family 4 protein [Opitutales bacterium]|jgi:glycosyltransferase involved in cell wall biosynthesis